MKFFVGVTDYDWFRQLEADRASEVNFWLPSPDVGFAALLPGQPFLFKLKKKYGDHIVGGGFFAGYSVLPVSIAWEAFGRDNGVPDRETLQAKIAGYNTKATRFADPNIGCIILTDVFYLDQSQWISKPSDWSENLTRGKTYNMSDHLASELWQQVGFAVESSHAAESQVLDQIKQPVRTSVYSKSYLQKARLGQGAFRVLTLQNYGNRCCITGETTVPVLQAAHIQAVHKNGDHQLQNGLLMRADMHILFDKGLIGVDADYKIRISPQIRESYLNGKVYYEHDGQHLRSLPKDAALRPDRELLHSRMKEIFVN